MPAASLGKEDLPLPDPIPTLDFPLGIGTLPPALPPRIPALAVLPPTLSTPRALARPVVVVDVDLLPPRLSGGLGSVGFSPRLSSGVGRGGAGGVISPTILSFMVSTKCSSMRRFWLLPVHGQG